MKFAVVTAHVDDFSYVQTAAERLGFTLDEQNPELVICFGGDGTFLRAERQYPGVPKLPTRKSRVCKKCHNFPLDIALEKVLAGNVEQFTLPKLRALVHAGNTELELFAINDVAVRNTYLPKALRFSIDADGRKIGDELIGDGVVVATSFGSTGYYHSITGETFDEGFALAFSNNTQRLAPLHFGQGSIQIQIIRGPAQIAADNFSPDLELYEQDTVTISLSSEHAIILQPR